MMRFAHGLRPRLLAPTILAVVLAPAPLRAGGPLVVTTSGDPVGWSTAAPISYVTDRGGLGVLTPDVAVATVADLFQPWAAVPTATIGFQRIGATAVDVDASNFGPFLGPYGGATTPLGKNVIVFDADGSIFDELFGVGTGVLGFAGPTFLSDGITTVPIGAAVPPGARIVEGIAFLNGKWIDGVEDFATGNFELPLSTFEAAFVHEFGHFAGLDHTQLHGLSGPADSDSPFPTQPVETMFSFLVDEGQRTLERDDMVALSSLYPSADFVASTGRITGRVFTNDGTPLSGVNVVARNLFNGADAVSGVSGATLTPPGAFTLAGLTPGGFYTVDIQEIDVFAQGGSGVGPFSPPVIVQGPPEFYNAAESADPATDDPSDATPIASVAGLTTSGVDITLNKQRFAVSNVPVEDFNQQKNFATADFDGDGIVDFVAPEAGFFTGTIRLYRGRGDGTFDAPVTVGDFPGSEHVVAGQFNAGLDAFPDFAVAGALSVRVYFGNGFGGFGAPLTLIEVPGGAFSDTLVDLAVGDLNADGSSDLVTQLWDIQGGNGTTYAFLGSPGGNFTAVATPMVAADAFPKGKLLVTRAGGDASLDVVGVSSSIPAVLAVLIGNGAGGFRPTAVPIPLVSARIDTEGVALGDFNEDGVADVALSDLSPIGGPPNFTRSFIDILLGNGASGFAFSTRYEIPESFASGVVTADLDGDGHLDVASTGAFFGNGHPGAKVVLGFGDGAGGIARVDTVWGLAEFPTFLVAADLDGDDRTDLLVGSASFAFNVAAAPYYSVLLQNLCGNGTLDGGEECDDGNALNGDGCDRNCTFTRCGNHVLTAGEECDDGNNADGDGCSATCEHQAICGDGLREDPETCDDGNRSDGDCCSSACEAVSANTPCADDGSLCTRDVCDGAGECRHPTAPPASGCRLPVSARGGALAISDNPRLDSRNRLTWTWAHGAVTPKAAFGTPLTSTRYGLCIYDADEHVIAALDAPAGGVCGTRGPVSCWKKTQAGFRYLDAAVLRNGLRRIDLAASVKPGKARVAVNARGNGLGLPSLPVPGAALPLRVQLRSSDGECWEAVYSGLESNKRHALRARSD